MSRTYKDQPTRKAQRRAAQELGARILLGYQIERTDDPADNITQQQAFADYVREGGYVDFLLGRNGGTR